MVYQEQERVQFVIFTGVAMCLRIITTPTSLSLETKDGYTEKPQGFGVLVSYFLFFALRAALLINMVLSSSTEFLTHLLFLS